MKSVVRRRIVERGLRPDGRKPERDSSHLGRGWRFSPRAHGSGLFTRGETQVLTMATLGTPKEAQELDNLAPFRLQALYPSLQFPALFDRRSQNAARLNPAAKSVTALWPNARCCPVIPSEKDFPYTLRLVSEVLSSNGSSSMASVCGSTLALMDTGVPIKAPVAGIAMGLIKEDGSNHAS